MSTSRRSKPSSKPKPVKSIPKNQVVKPTIDPTGIFDKYDEKKLLQALMELLKNMSDWARDYREFPQFKFWDISFDSENKVISCTDFGRGLGVTNRSAWLSFDKSTADPKTMHGKYGNGSKQLMISWCKDGWVECTTVSEEQPDIVWHVKFKVLDLQKVVITNLSRKPEDMIEVEWKWAEKTAENWPFDSPTGTVMTYQLSKQLPSNMNSVERFTSTIEGRIGNNSVARSCIRINNQVLPEYVYTRFNFSQGKIFKGYEDLGLVSVDLMRKRTEKSTEKLMCTGRILADIDFRAQVLTNDALSDKQKLVLPKALLDSQVIGIINCELFQQYTTADREKIDSNIFSDPRLYKLLKLLRELEPEIITKLNLKPQPSKNDQEAVKDAVNRFVQDISEPVTIVEGPPEDEKNLPDDDDKNDDNTNTDEKDRDKDRNPAVITLRVPEEVGLNEEFKASYSTKILDPENLKPDIDPCFKLISEAAGSMTLRAQETGKAYISIYDSVTGYIKRKIVNVVEPREPRLVPGDNLTPIQLLVDSTIKLRIVNADLFVGTPVWEINHPERGKLSVTGNSATFSAGPGIGPVTVLVKCSDESHAYPQMFCNFDVNPKPPGSKRIIIQDDHFVIDETDSLQLGPNDAPVKVNLIGRGECNNTIRFNMDSPILISQRESREAFARELSLAYAAARFFRKNSEDIELMDTNPSEYLRVVQEPMNELAAEVYIELLEKLKD